MQRSEFVLVHIKGDFNLGTLKYHITHQVVEEKNLNL